MTRDRIGSAPRRRSGGVPEATTLGVPLSDRLIAFVGLPLLVLAVGLALPPLARWVLAWEKPLPFGFVFKLVGAVDRWWEMVINVGIWVVVALAAVVAWWAGSLVITLTGAEIRVKLDKDSRTISRADVSAVFVDGNRLVILDRRSRQVLREVHEAPEAVLAEAFRRHGYPWQDTDPYAELFRPWSRGAADLPPAADDVFAARAAALKKKAKKEARDLASALEHLGYVVRDEGVRQYWRPLVRA